MKAEHKYVSNVTAEPEGDFQVIEMGGPKSATDPMGVTISADEEWAKAKPALQAGEIKNSWFKP